MTDVAAFLVPGVVLAAAGGRLGVARLGVLLASALLGVAGAFVLGPRVHAAGVFATGWNTWLGVALAWVAAYAAVAVPAAILLGRRVRRPPSRRGRGAGAVAGMLLGGCSGWLLFAPGAERPDGPVEWVQAPFATLRALRILRSVSPEEAQWIVDRPEVKAVAESESLRPLLRDDALVRRMQEASDGDRWALLALAADPQVKAAMDDPAFLERVRRVDLVILAEAVSARRGGLPVAEVPAREGTEAWRFGYAVGSRLRDGLRSLRGDGDRVGSEAVPRAPAAPGRTGS